MTSLIDRIYEIRAVLKNAETTGPLYSSPMLVKLYLKSFKLGFNITWTETFQMFKLGSENQRNQRSNCQHLLACREIKGIPEIYLPLFHDYAKVFDSVEHNKQWKTLKRWEYQTTLPASWEICMHVKKQVRTGHGTTDWFHIGKGVCQGCILSPCLFNLYTEYIMWNARLDEAQVGVKNTGRNINSLRYADHTTLMVESEELKSLLMKVKEESEKVDLNLNIQKTKIMASGPITSWQIDKETMATVKDFIYLFFWLQIHCRLWLQSWN